jgi:hypothetical protein
VKNRVLTFSHRRVESNWRPRSSLVPSTASADLHVNGVTGDLVDLQLNEEDDRHDFSMGVILASLIRIKEMCRIQ